MAEKKTRIRFPGQRRFVRQQIRVGKPTFPNPRTPAKPRWVKYGLKIKRVGEVPADFYLSVAPPDTPTTSDLERLVYGWLVRHRVPFSYQVSVLGGRQVPGGAVLDFVVFLRQPVQVIRIMGTYMHIMPAQSYNDLIQKMVLQELGYEVIDIWEGEITDMAIFETTMQRVIYGGRRFSL